MAAYYKLSDADYLTWLNNFISIASMHSAELNLTAAQITELTAKRDALETKINQRVAAEETVKSSVTAQRMARTDSQEEISFYNKAFRVIPTITPDMLERLGLIVSSGVTYSPPTAPLDLVATGYSNGLNILKWNRNDNIPSTLFIIECRSGSAPTEWMQVGATKKTTFEHRLTKSGEQCIYRVYANRNNQNSPFSNEAIVYLNV